MSEAISVFC
jgi:hypothetical protein